ncbi:hypothetical protein O9A_00322 [Bartonella koehlerae C-29]|uniref:Uncharacterized protein n=1 Tax=Bartonella koehlerae C-29 TaxID=1134510 RepID=A0A067WJK7_9HYPH|nr:hypothetical protein O9A_00322 [Bartonella koehlerae C-29]
MYGLISFSDAWDIENFPHRFIEDVHFILKTKTQCQEFSLITSSVV